MQTAPTKVQTPPSKAQTAPTNLQTTATKLRTTLTKAEYLLKEAVNDQVQHLQEDQHNDDPFQECALAILQKVLE
jgi:hypothetical protein